MISTTAPRIVFIGDSRNWSTKWVDLKSEEGKRYTRKELHGLKIIRSNIDGIESRVTQKQISKDYFARFIDNSEFVVRCERLRTLSGASVDVGFGKKTDAIVGPHCTLKAMKKNVNSLFETLLPRDAYKHIIRNRAIMTHGEIHKYSNLTGNMI